MSIAHWVRTAAIDIVARPWGAQHVVHKMLYVFITFEGVFGEGLHELWWFQRLDNWFLEIAYVLAHFNARIRTAWSTMNIESFGSYTAIECKLVPAATGRWQDCPGLCIRLFVSTPVLRGRKNESCIHPAAPDRFVRSFVHPNVESSLQSN